MSDATYGGLVAEISPAEASPRKGDGGDTAKTSPTGIGIGVDDVGEDIKKLVKKKQSFIDPIFQYESLRDTKMIDYYCQKMAA